MFTTKRNGQANYGVNYSPTWIQMAFTCIRTELEIMICESVFVTTQFSYIKGASPFLRPQGKHKQASYLISPSPRLSFEPFPLSTAAILSTHKVKLNQTAIRWDISSLTGGVQKGIWCTMVWDSSHREMRLQNLTLSSEQTKNRL